MLAATRNEFIPVPEELKGNKLLEIAFRAMEKRPAKRYQSVAEFQDALREWISHSESLTIMANVLNASLTDCVFEVERETTLEEVNALFKAASEGDLKGILGYEERPLVSADYTNDTRSTIIDALSTMVVNGTQVKVYAWYDNEMGYAWRLADVARMVAA